MSNRLADNISPALMAQLDQTAAEMLAMALIHRNGEVEMHAAPTSRAPTLPPPFAVSPMRWNRHD